MKKFVIIILFFIQILFFCVKPVDVAYAESNANNDISKSIDEKLSSIDFSALEKLIAGFGQDDFGLFGAGSFYEKVKNIISGSLSSDFSSFWSYIGNIFFDDVLNFVPILSAIVAISILCSFVGHLSPSGKTKSVSNVVFFACFGVIIVLTIGGLMPLMKASQNVLSFIKVQVEAIFPILLVLMSAVGGVTTAASFQPLVGIFAGGVIKIFTGLVIPLFIFSLVFSIVGNLSNNVKLDKFGKFFMSIFKWIVGGIFTIFMGFVSIKGLTAASIDGISIKTAKFALKSYVPILGGYLSEGLNLIIASSMFIKNAVGATGLIILFITVLGPLINLVVFSLGLKLAASIIEPFGDAKISNFLMVVSSAITMLIVSLVAVSFMYLIIVGMLMLSGNIL